MEASERGRERQHFLLRAEAVDVGEGEIARLTDDEAYAIFERYRFADKDGVPFCPHCDAENAYRLTINRRTKQGLIPTRLYKCRNQSGDRERAKDPCGRQFSVTSGTAFHGRKMPVRDILYALIVFVDAASGVAALRLRRALKCSYKTSFVLAGKLREAIHRSRAQRPLHGVVEVDGTVVGGHDRKAAMKENGREKRIGFPSRRKAFVGLRERRPDGESRIEVFAHEAHYRDLARDYDYVRDNVEHETNMISDESFESGYIGQHDRVKHKDGFKTGGVHNNGIEGLFARVKRAEEGVFYGWGSNDDYLRLYGAEVCWREDYRRRSNGELWRMLVHAVSRPRRSLLWARYWQRWEADDLAIRRRKRAA